MNAIVALCNDDRCIIRHLKHAEGDSPSSKLWYIKMLNEDNYNAVLTSPQTTSHFKNSCKETQFWHDLNDLTGLKAYAPHQSVEPIKPFEWKVYKKLMQEQLPSFPHIDTFEIHKSNSSLKPITVKLQWTAACFTTCVYSVTTNHYINGLYSCP